MSPMVDFTISVLGSSTNSLIFGLILSCSISLFIHILAFHSTLGMPLNRKRKQWWRKKSVTWTAAYRNCKIHGTIRLAANLYKLNTMKTFQNIFWKTMSVLPIFVQCMYIHDEIFLFIAIMYTIGRVNNTFFIFQYKNNCRKSYWMDWDTYL